MNTPDHPKKRSASLGIVLVLICLAISIWLITRFGATTGTLISEVKKITAVMNLINTNYVDKPNLSRLSEGAIEGMLKRLDPHSIYIPVKDQERIKENDVGRFDGIGISFIIQNELINVIAPIPGTPADRLGIRSGDRIVEIDGVSAYGITNEEVFRKLRGPKGSTVKVAILREGVPAPLQFTIVRDAIPIHSVWTRFMLDDSTGYIMLNQFTATTTAELSYSLRELEAQGMTRLLFDLRNNQGGRLIEAVHVADMFIPGGQAIVSRRGRNSSDDTTYYSTNLGTHTLFNLIILVNGGSASASEIVAGAIQDLDRGLIVGENTFGKGLVQYPYHLPDGAVIRLSTSHWYTPSGRLVQRPYDKGRGEYYAVRYRDPDSTQAGDDNDEFRTLGGRKVLSSSGITPDVEVDDRKITGATAQLINARVLYELAQQLVKENNFNPSTNFTEFRRKFIVTDGILARLKDLAMEKDLQYSDEAIKLDNEYLVSQVKAEMAQLIWSKRDYYYLIRTELDPVVSRALEVFPDSREVATLWNER